MKSMTRRELLKEMVSKDTLKHVMSAWYGFSKPFMQESVAAEKKESLLEKVQKINIKNAKTTLKQNGKEG